MTKYRLTQIANHIPAFTIHHLAEISDCLEQTGELYVWLYPPHGAGAEYQYLIRSLKDLKLLVQEQHDWNRMVFTLYRDVQVPLRGIADARLLEQALQQFLEGQMFCMLEFAYYPDECLWVTQGNSHALLIRSFARKWGYPVAIGLPPSDEDENVIEVDSGPYTQASPNQETYAPYDANPARYQWIVDLWMT